MSHPLDNLDDEIREHIERETRENIERGMTPADARAAALRKFGNVARVMEDTRAVWKWTWLEQFFQDARYGWRGMRRNPRFAAVVVLTLAVAIGLNTAVFSLVNALLIRPLPYPDPDRLVWITNYSQMFKSEMVNGADYAYWRTQARSFEAMVAYGYGGRTITTSEGAEQRLAADVTSDFWKISGVRPALGRLPLPGERDAAVLADPLYEQQFHRDPHILGRRFVDHGDSFTVVGVLPKGFRSLLPHGINPFRALTNATEPELYLPNPAEWEQPSGKGGNSIELVVAKRKPGVSLEAARTEMEGIQSRVRQVHPDFYSPGQLLVTTLREKLVQNVRVGLLVLLAAVSFVLLIACANVANLLLARGATRQKEIAIRTALGAGRGRVMRQFLGENLSLALLGGAGGVLFARAAAPLIARLAAGSLPGFAEANLDGRVLLFALAASLVTGILFSISPALFLRRAAPYDMLKQGGRTSSSGSAGLPVRRFLVAAEMALALVLVIGAALMVKSFWRMNAHPADFAPERILTMKVSLAMPKYRDEAKQKAYWPELLRRVESVPGVQAAGVVNAYVRGVVETPDSVPLPARQAPPGGAFYGISPGVTRILGLRLVKGRWLTDHEPSLSILVNESLAREMFGAADPIGRQLKIPTAQPRGGDTGTIVGVVGDLRYSRLDEPPEPEIYIPYERTPVLLNLTVMVRTSAGASNTAPTVRKLIADIDRANPVYQVQTLEHALSDSIAPRRFNLFLLGVLAGSALLLALIGIYGVMAYAVTQRRQEIGVRMALGARRGQVVALVVREGMSLAAAGIATGLAAAFGLTRLMSSLLYDVKATDPSTFAMVAGMLTATALAACWKPALQAAWVDPALALREE